MREDGSPDHDQPVVEVRRQALQTWNDGRYKNSSPGGTYLTGIWDRAPLWKRALYHYRERSVKIPGLRRWLWASSEGNGHLISLGLGLSLGWGYGTVVLTLPFVELSVGYTDSGAGAE